MNENDFHTRCYDARITLKFAVSMCIPIFNFYNGPIYQVLDVILRESYPDEENNYIRNAELSSTDYVYVNNYRQCTAPNVDQCFNSDRRSISYWLNRKEKIQKLEECWKYFPDALKALQDYEKHVNQHDSLKCKCDEWLYRPYTYDKKIYLDAFTGAFDMELPVTIENEVSFVNDVVYLLKDDELLEEDFQPKFTSIDICQGTDEEKQAIYDLAHLGRVYVVCSALYGNTYSGDIVSVPDQILLTKILNAECCSAMIDAACSFVLKAQNYSSLQSKLIPPPHNILRAAKKEISAHELKPLTVSEAVYLVSSAQQYHVIDSTCLPDLQIPSIKSGSNCTMEDYRNFLCNLKGVRCRILYEVSEQQFRNTQINNPKNDSFIHVTFPYFELLEYRFMEEIAALEKCLKFGDGYKLQASRLSLSLYRRIKWLFTEFESWAESSMSYTIPVKSKETKLHLSMFEEFIMCIAITSIGLVSIHGIFSVYLSSSDTTIHPIIETTRDLIFESQKYFIKIQKELQDKCEKDETLSECHNTLEIIVDQYLEQLVLDCCRAWNVSKIGGQFTGKSKLYNGRYFRKAYDNMLNAFLNVCISLLSNKQDSSMSGFKYLSKSMDILMDLEVSLRKPTDVEEIANQLMIVTHQLFEHDSKKISIKYKKGNGRGGITLVEKKETVKEKKNERKNRKKEKQNSKSCRNKSTSLESSNSNKNNQHVKEIDEDTKLTSLNPTQKVCHVNKSTSNIDKSICNEDTCSKNDESSVKIANDDSNTSVRKKNTAPKDKHSDVSEKFTKNVEEPKPHSEVDERSMKNIRSQNLKKCFTCNDVEPGRHVFKKCSLCAKYKWKTIRFYCSEECQAKDWKIKHCQEHRENIQ